MKQRIQKLALAYYLALILAGMTQLARADDKAAAPAPSQPAVSSGTSSASSDEKKTDKDDDDDDDNEENGEHEG